MAKIIDRLEVLESTLKGKEHLPRTPVDLAKLDTNNQYMVPLHLKLLNEKLLEVEKGKIKRLMVFMPPRHGKSTIISHYFPAWYLSHHPHSRIILTSYEADFASSWGRKVRNCIQEHQAELGISVDENSAASFRFDLSHYYGGMITAGVGGAITGRGANVLVIDDPVKNAEEVNSQTLRSRTYEWYRSTAHTRLEPDGAIIIIQTRWHQDDLSGKLLDEMLNDKGDHWEVISLPAFAEENDVLNRDLDDPLWPERYPTSVLLEKKQAIGSYWFSALYQQRPQPAEGVLLKKDWIKYYESLPKDFVTYQGWDLAISEKTSADYTCSCSIGVDQSNGDIYILDWTRERIDFPTQLRRVQEKANQYNPSLILLESTAYQAALPQALREKTNLPIREVKPVRDKVTRITSRFVLFENGKVFLPKDHWLNDVFLEEFTYFPKSKHDDMLDCTEICLSAANIGINPYTESEQFYEDSRHHRKFLGDWRSRHNTR